jgi:SpoIID/LytB domain protein
MIWTRSHRTVLAAVAGTALIAPLTPPAAGLAAPLPAATGQARPAPAATPAPVTGESYDELSLAAAPGARTAAVSAHRTGSFSMIGVTWPYRASSADVTARMRVFQNGRWTSWQQLHIEEENGIDPAQLNRGRSGTEPFWVGPASGAQVSVTSADGAVLRGAKVSLIDPGSRATDAGAPPEAGADGKQSTASRAPFPMTPITTRAGWGADERMRSYNEAGCATPRYGATVHAAFIHHTADSNSYSSSQVPAMLRSTLAYHVKSRGWCDIGYNFLVDKFGRAFEGRHGGMQLPVIGAHTGGYNLNSFGISLIGNYDLAAPSAATMDRVARIIAWKFDANYRSPLKTVVLAGKTLNAISGHRDTKQTACPGKYVYSRLPWLRQRVWALQNGACLHGDLPLRALSRRVRQGRQPLLGGACDRRRRPHDVVRAARHLLLQYHPGALGPRRLPDPVPRAEQRTRRPRAADRLAAVRRGAWHLRAVLPPRAALPVRRHHRAAGVRAHLYEVRAARGGAVGARVAHDGGLQGGAGTQTGVRARLDELERRHRRCRLQGDLMRNRRGFAAAAVLVTVASGLAVIAAGPPAAGVIPALGAVAEAGSQQVGATTISGRGYGHGRGMSQYGSQGAALAGRSATQILDFYYPGTTTGALFTTLRVRIVADTTDGVRVTATPGLRFRDVATGRVWPLPVSASKDHWSIEPYGEHGTRLRSYDVTTRAWTTWRSPDGRTAFTAMGQFEGPPVIPLILPTNERVLYRTALRSADTAGVHLDTINHIPLETYLRGVVPLESPASWQPAALQAQSVAARTYAAYHRSQAGARSYDLCDTTACQVYGGYNAEVASTNAAILASSGQIRLYGNQPIIAEYSASNGGATVAGGPAYQVLKADPWDGYPGNRNPYLDWSTPRSASTLQSAFGVGALDSLRVLTRTGVGPWGGRVLTVEVVGSTGRKVLTGDEVRRRLDLRTDLFRLG